MRGKSLDGPTMTKGRSKVLDSPKYKKEMQLPIIQMLLALEVYPLEESANLTIIREKEEMVTITPLEVSLSAFQKDHHVEEVEMTPRTYLLYLLFPLRTNKMKWRNMYLGG